MWFCLCFPILEGSLMCIPIRWELRALAGEAQPDEVYPMPQIVMEGYKKPKHWISICLAVRKRHLETCGQS